MTNKKSKKEKYEPPRIEVLKLTMECSFAASSVLVIPGGGVNNSNPWITEEEREVKNKDWDFFD